MTDTDLSGVQWRKAARSGPAGGNCAEVAVGLPGGMTAVRDSKRPENGAHVVGQAAFGDFLDAAKSGRFDLR